MVGLTICSLCFQPKNSVLFFVEKRTQPKESKFVILTMLLASLLVELEMTSKERGKNHQRRKAVSHQVQNAERQEGFFLEMQLAIFDVSVTVT